MPPLQRVSKVDVSRHRELMTKITQELASFDHSTLRSEPVYFVASDGHHPITLNLLKTHSFVVTGSPGYYPETGVEVDGCLIDGSRRIDSRKVGRVYSCGKSIMHMPFDLNGKLKRAILSSLVISKRAKAIVNAMSVASYPTVEAFIRTYLQNKDDLSLDGDELLEQASIPDSDLQEMALLNRQVNGYHGAVTALPFSVQRVQKDHQAFMRAGPDVVFALYADASAQALKDIYQQELLKQRYLDEQLAMGKSTKPELKRQHCSGEMSASLDAYVHYTLLPRNSRDDQANCNKAAATLLQATLKRSENEPKKVKPLSFFSVGASQRMALWQPVDSLKVRMYDLIHDPEKVLSDEDLQYFLRRKSELVRLIFALPSVGLKLRACSQVRDKLTALGTIFHTRSKGFWQERGGMSKHLAKIGFLHNSLLCNEMQPVCRDRTVCIPSK